MAARLEQERTQVLAELAEKQRLELEEEMKQFQDLKNTRDTAQQAVDNANTIEVTFDFEGVAKHLKNPHQIDVFRETVLSDGIRPYLPKDNQAELAAHIAKLADAPGQELTGRFIRDNIVTLVIDSKRFQRHLDEETKERLRRDSITTQAFDAMGNFVSALHRLQGEGMRITKLVDKWPQGQQFPVTSGFQEALRDSLTIINELLERIFP